MTPEQRTLIALGLFKGRCVTYLDPSSGEVKGRPLPCKPNTDKELRRQRLYFAYLVALAWRRGDWEDVRLLTDSFCGSNSGARVDFLKLVASAVEGGSEFDPTDTRRRLIDAHDAAWLESVKSCVSQAHAEGRKFSSLDVKPPTLKQWETQFERLFPDVSLPKEGTFKRAARELKLLCSSRRPRGRPPGSVDSELRTRRSSKRGTRKRLRR